MSDAIIGTGINGKRLWMYDLAGQWVPVPTGAGENATIRSVNVWDGHRWQVVTDPTPLYERRSSLYHYPSLQMYAPGRAWGPGSTNPNYQGSGVSSAPWEPKTPDWLRLFHLAPRVDPNWRIVQLYDAYPQQTRSQQRQSANSRVPFFPRGGLYLEHRYDELDPVSLQWYGKSESGVRAHSFQFADNSYYDGSFFEDWAYVRNTKAIPGQPGAVGASSTYDENECSGLLDLIAIRDRLSKEFSQRDPYFNRQYTPISKMTLKRVIIHGGFIVSGLAIGLAPTLPPAQSRVFAQVGTTVTTFTDPSTTTWPTGPYTLGRPTSSTAGSGIVIASCGGYDSTEVQPNLPNAPVTISGIYENELDYTFENPLEDNIGFFVEVTDFTPGGSTSLQRIAANFYIKRIALHYATQGHDVPAKYRNASDNGYPVAYEIGG